MSGQIIIFPLAQLFNPAIYIAGGTLIGAGAATLALAAGAKKLVDMQVDAALRKREQEKAQLAQWIRYQQAQQERMNETAAVEAALQAAEQLLASLELSVVTADKRVAAEGPDAPSIRSYLALKGRKSPDEIAIAFVQLSSVLRSFPQELRALADSPYSVLEKKCASLKARIKAGERVRWDEITSLEQTIVQTIQRFIQQTRASHEHQAEMAAQLEAVLDDVLYYRNVAVANPFLESQRTGLDTLRAQVTALLDAGELRTGQLGMIQKRLATLRAEIDMAVVQTAHRTALCESVSRNLVDMGYQELEAFDVYDKAMASATLRIPGGERINIAVHQNGQAAFEFQHERAEDSGPMSREEWAFFRQQERKWCKDAKELLRRLIVEGFDYQMSLEKEVSEQAIKVVVVETADELAAHDYLEEPQKRYRDR